MKGDRLTMKQERFCLNLFQGMSQREAYIKAGYSEKQGYNSVDRNACILACNTKVVQRLDQLKKKAESNKVVTVIERKEYLSEVIRNTEEETQNRLKGCDLLNKMERIGTHESDISINVLVQRIVNNLTVNNLNIEQLSDDELRLLSMGDNGDT